MANFNNNEPSAKKNIFSVNPLSPQDKNSQKIFIVMPAYNEERTVGEVLQELCERNYCVIVVDDGSKDQTSSIVNDIRAKHPQKIFICQHLINQGLGAALRTGIQCALNLGANYIVTFDADGQHHPEDVAKIIEPLQKGDAQVALGKRNYDKMPISKKIANQIMNMITRIFYNMRVNDSQCGLRGLDQETASLLEVKSRGYAVSSEIIKEIKKNNLKMVEVPITTIYTDYSLAKGTNTSIGLAILFKMIMEFFKKF